MSRGKAGIAPYQHGQSSKHVTGLLNNGCLFKSVNYGGERGGWLPTPLSSFTPRRRNQIREGKVTTVYSYFEIQINLP